MIDADVKLVETYSDEEAKTMTIRFLVELKNGDRPPVPIVWPVILDLSRRQEPPPETLTRDLLQVAFAVFETQLEAIRQKIRHNPRYEAATVATYKSALAAQDAE